MHSRKRMMILVIIAATLPLSLFGMQALKKKQSDVAKGQNPKRSALKQVGRKKQTQKIKFGEGVKESSGKKASKKQDVGYLAEERELEKQIKEIQKARLETEKKEGRAEQVLIDYAKDTIKEAKRLKEEYIKNSLEICKIFGNEEAITDDTQAKKAYEQLSILRHANEEILDLYSGFEHELAMYIENAEYKDDTNKYVEELKNLLDQENILAPAVVEGYKESIKNDLEKTFNSMMKKQEKKDDNTKYKVSLLFGKFQLEHFNLQVGSVKGKLGSAVKNGKIGGGMVHLKIINENYELYLQEKKDAERQLIINMILPYARKINKTESDVEQELE